MITLYIVPYYCLSGVPCSTALTQYYWPLLFLQAFNKQHKQIMGVIACFCCASPHVAGISVLCFV